MRPKIEIPRALLEQAVRRGRTLGDIRRGMRRLGVEVSLPTIRERLGEAGLRLSTQHDPWTPVKSAERRAQRGADHKHRQVQRRVGRVEGQPVWRAIFTPQEWARLQRWPALEAQELLERQALLARGRQGDPEALAALRTRYKLRLPLVEQRLQPQMNADERRSGEAA